MSGDWFGNEVSRHIWDSKYRYRDGDKPREATVEESWWRVARALASVEPREPERWAERFFDALRGFRFLPGGRIQAGAGTAHQVTLFNCFVMGRIEDSLESIFDNLREGALTMQQGGGVGYDFSTLRPRGTVAHSTGGIASGPVSFMRIWDSMCATILSTGARRGAMMGTLRCDHPDIEEFIAAKADRHELRHFNLSVQVTDAFMEAVARDAPWPLLFPAAALGEGEGGETIMRRWPGHDAPVACRVLRRVGARTLWGRIMRATYDYSEPGVLFVDRVNRENNLRYCEYISATNPCGEIPLPPYGACDLGSINLTRFVLEPFTERARLDIDAVLALVGTAVRMLDNVIDLSRFPLARQAEKARDSRRIGLGVTGLGDALIMLGLHYGTPAAREWSAALMKRIAEAAYHASAELAKVRGPFPGFRADAYLEAPFVARLPEPLREAIHRHGIRNSHLLAVAPTGTVSLLANNVSSGVEPLFARALSRRVLELDGSYHSYPLTDYAYALWRRRFGEAPLPEAFVEARQLPPQAHLQMVAALQPHVDNAISKTINVPADYSFDAFRSLYEEAYRLGLKGCTTFRPNPITGAILTEAAEEGTVSSHCCSIEREAD